MTLKLINCNKETVEVKIYFISLTSYSARIFKKDRQFGYPVSTSPSLKIPKNNEKGNFGFKDSILFSTNESVTQLAITCSNSIIKTLEQGVKSTQVNKKDTRTITVTTTCSFSC